jgi:hypothetical protein
LVWLVFQYKDPVDWRDLIPEIAAVRLFVTGTASRIQPLAAVRSLFDEDHCMPPVW